VFLHTAGQDPAGGMFLPEIRTAAARAGG